MRRPIAGTGAGVLLFLSCLWPAFAFAEMELPVKTADSGFSETFDYEITWAGISLGKMNVWSHSDDDDGRIERGIHIKSHRWLSGIYPVDNRIVCLREKTTNGERFTVTKVIHESTFQQHDILILRPNRKKAEWTNVLEERFVEYEIPEQARDYVSFFFAMREALQTIRDTNNDFQLVMDEGIHALEIKIGDKTNRVKTAKGKAPALSVDAISKSPVLFSRNKPRSIWVSTTHPIILSTEASTKFGPVRIALKSWNQNGEEMNWMEAAK